MIGVDPPTVIQVAHDTHLQSSSLVKKRLTEVAVRSTISAWKHDVMIFVGQGFVLQSL